MDIDTPSLGAFEISHDGNIIFSKMKSGMFPITSKIALRVKNYVDDFKNGGDVKKYSLMKEERAKPKKKELDARNTYGSWYVLM